MIRRLLLLLPLIAGSFSQASAQAEPFRRWMKADKTTDQSTTDPEQHSGLPAYGANRKEDVMDTDLRDLIKDLKSKPNLLWVFAQCFGGGMFDELNELPNTQAGISASNFDETSRYPLRNIDGFPATPFYRGGDFAFSYLSALLSPNLSAKRLAIKAATNDPWGQADNPFPARNGETKGAEYPVYFSKGAGADALLVAPQKQGLAILFAGQPNLVDDRQVGLGMVELCALGYDPLQIFVLFGPGVLRKLPPAGGPDPKKPVSFTAQAMTACRIPNDHLYPGMKTSLKTVLNFKFTGEKTDPAQLFFFTNDHGLNTAENDGNPRPRAGDGGIAINEPLDPDDAGAFIQGNDPSKPPKK